MLNKLLSKVFGDKNERDIKKIEPYVGAINGEYAKLHNLTNDELRNKTIEFRERISDYLSEIDAEIEELNEKAIATEDFHEKEEVFEEIDEIKKERDKAIEEILEELLPEAFAVVKETARRFTENEAIKVTATDHDRIIATKGDYVEIDGDQAIWQSQWTAAGGEVIWNMIHYDVQLIGGVVLHQGKIAEMQTGEGKTLVATLPAYLNALTGEGVHVVTVNNYLARRDAEWIGPIMEFLLLTIDCIDNYKPHTDERKRAYRCDITYGTNNEFGFDYLRDNMVRDVADLVQRKHHFAMVDEIDSILIDDARTPLIISGPISRGEEDQEYQALKPIVEKLYKRQRDMVSGFITTAKKLINDGNTGVQEGEGGLALFRAYRGLPKSRALIKYTSEYGIKAIREKTENYYMQEQSKHMHIADEPLLFTIDEKNRSVELTERGAEYLASLTDDANFFVMPDIASEMNDIEMLEGISDEEKIEKKEKLISDYSVKSKRLHSINQLLKAYTLFERDVEYLVQEDKVKIIDEQTGRLMEGRRYSDGLHQAIEAKENVKIEAATQTYATVTLQNYFRMYHKLSGMTGTAETEAGEFWEIYKLDVVCIPTNRPIARDDRQDKVYRTEREKFKAIIDEVEELTKQGRPILVGTTSVEVSEKLSRFLNLKKIPHNVLNAKQHQAEAQVVADAGKAGQVTIATNMAGRGTDIKISDEVKAAGGLAIIGTERHDSRRVDRQLRGRAGRQGDPGSSQFYVSLEDPLMRMFQSERITKLMDRMGYSEGEVIQHSMVTKSIERAQKRVEENNFGIRKRLLEYDDVMNIQREAIYKRRHNALSGERLSVDINNMFMELSEELVNLHKYQGGDYESLKLDTLLYFGLEPKFSQADFAEGRVEELVEQLQEQVLEDYQRKTNKIRNGVMPFMRNVHESQGHQIKYVEIPFTDGKKAMRVVANLQDSIDTDGESIIMDIEKSITLAMLDNEWKEHLRGMDELKESSYAAQFEQKDPLVIYKREAYHKFAEFISNLNRDVISFLAKGNVPLRSDDDVKQARKPSRRAAENTQTNRGEDGQPQAAGPRQERRQVETVVRGAAPKASEKVKVRYKDGTVKRSQYRLVRKDVEAGLCVLVEEEKKGGKPTNGRPKRKGKPPRRKK